MEEIKIKQEFKFTGGDCISHYNASFEKDPTLEEFVEWILTNRSGEWGQIEDVGLKNKRCRPEMLIKYKRGKVVECCDDYDEIKSKNISLIGMDGGWSNMDYLIECRRNVIDSSDIHTPLAIFFDN